MVLKHATRETEKIVDSRKEKAKSMKKELSELKKILAKRVHNDEVQFNTGFVLALILLCRSYEPLHEHAFNILQEAGYELNDFNHIKMDPSDRKTLHKIFSI